MWIEGIATRTNVTLTAARAWERGRLARKSLKNACLSTDRRIVELCVGFADATLHQKDRKKASFENPKIKACDRAFVSVASLDFVVFK